MAFSFGASAQPTTPDGTVVGRVNPRRNGNEDFMAMLAKAFEQMMGGQGRETTAQKLSALRNDPIGDANKAAYLKATTVDNQGGMGPMTRASGMTPEQVARMQGPTAANQWKFPELFKGPLVQPDNGWVLPSNLGPNSTVQSSPDFGKDFDAESAKVQKPPFNFFGLPEKPKKKAGGFFFGTTTPRV